MMPMISCSHWGMHFDPSVEIDRIISTVVDFTIAQCERGEASEPFQSTYDEHVAHMLESLTGSRAYEWTTEQIGVLHAVKAHTINRIFHWKID